LDCASLAQAVSLTTQKGNNAEEKVEVCIDVLVIVMQRLISIDGKVRTDKCYPAGFMGE
jgi:ribosomal protein S4E